MTIAMGAVVAVTVLLFPGADNVLKGVETDISPTVLLLLFVIATLAALVKGAIGFGAGLIATPIFASIIEPSTAVVVLTVMPWMITVFQMGETQTGLQYVRKEWPLVGLAFVGTLVGVYFLSVFSAGLIIPFLMGVLLIGYAVFEVGTGFMTIEQAHHPVALGFMGFLEGFLVAAANMGPPLPAYLHTFERDMERYIGGMGIVFTIIQSLRLVLMYPLGLLTPYRLWLGATIATVAIGGLFLGTFLRRFGLDQAKVDRAIIVLLCIIGLNLLRKTVPDLFF